MKLVAAFALLVLVAAVAHGHGLNKISIARDSDKCHATCSSNSQCEDSDECPICRIGTCSPLGECGDYCDSNDDCYGATCKTCMDNLCASPCGGTCQNDTDCRVIANTTCPYCQEGICEAGGCMSECASDTDCAEQGNCNSCEFSRCVAPCGGNCSTDAECEGAYTGCGLCTDGTCVKGDVCGHPCDNNGQCSGQCGLCDAGTFQCIAGGGCGASCTVNSDCAQGPTDCSVCKSEVCSAP